ncbi:hypothetical protein [Lacrimispora sp.]|uniref:hypothetical protein n=1 Tax=Lacrimispora sp. TaxID=2719234 RepID=UPI0028A979B9|nr:hypothetical protein [Lacrimispora sp.]
MKINNKAKIVLFLSGLFILLYGLSYVILPNNTMDSGLYKKTNSITSEPENTIDYIVIGDSEAVSSISPMEIWKDYGYTGYNIGVPGQRLQDTYYLLEKVLKKQSPKIIFLETNAFYRDFKYLNALDNMVDEDMKNLFPVYKFHSNWKYFHLNMLKNLKDKAADGPIVTYKGFKYVPVINPYKGGPYVKESDSIYPIGDQPTQYINNIIELCKDHNIQLILYSTPTPKNWTASKHNSATALANKNQLKFIDFNLMQDEVPFDWQKDTRDEGDHPNYSGSVKISSYIGAYLAKEGTLIDYRKDKNYESWNQDLIAYKKLTKQE